LRLIQGSDQSHCVGDGGENLHVFHEQSMPGAQPRQGQIQRASSHGSAPLAEQSSVAACRITVDVPDMTCWERVVDLFNRCRSVFRGGIRYLVIDLHAVTSADTKLIACLVAIHRMARAASVRLEVTLSQAVLEMTRLCRLERLARDLGLQQETKS